MGKIGGGTVLLLPESVFIIYIYVLSTNVHNFHSGNCFQVFIFPFVSVACSDRGGGESGSPSGTINPNDECTLSQ